MLYADGAGLLLVMALWLFCLFDAIGTDETQVRNLPKLVWVLIIILLFDIGAILWLVAGRPWSAPRPLPYKGNTGVPPADDRPGRSAAVHPDDDAAFLEGLRLRAEEQRRKAAEDARREQEDDGA